MVSRSNPRIVTPKLALDAFKAVDLRPLLNGGLETQVLFNLSSLRNGYSARCRGYINLSDSYSLEVIGKDFNVPKPLYFRREKGKIVTYYSGDRLPARLLSEPAGNLEFEVYAKEPGEYKGLNAFREAVLAGLLTDGYVHPNPQQTLVFGLLAGEKDPLSPVILCNPQSGLFIVNSDVGDCEVLSEEVIKKILRMYS